MCKMGGEFEGRGTRFCSRFLHKILHKFCTNPNRAPTLHKSCTNPAHKIVDLPPSSLLAPPSSVLPPPSSLVPPPRPSSSFLLVFSSVLRPPSSVPRRTNPAQTQTHEPNVPPHLSHSRVANCERPFHGNHIGNRETKMVGGMGRSPLNNYCIDSAKCGLQVSRLF